MRVLRRAVVALVAVSGLSLSIVSLAQAACPTANPAANIEGFTEARATLIASDKEVEANFTKARAAEGCAAPLVLPAGYDGMTAQQQMLWLFNNEREVRGLAPFKLDGTLMSQIALNHSKEMATYGYTNHPSPINQPQSVFARYEINPVFKTGAGLGEDIAWGNSTGESVYAYIYEDASQEWGHRDAILGNYNWVGIGALLNVAGSVDSNYFTDDFLNSATYTPPAAADTGAPTIGPVSYSNGTATVTGVADSPSNVNDKGATPYTGAITGVVFYTNSIVEANGAFNTIVGTETPAGSGTWTAKITVNTGEVLHAVAVDGSGNFTDSAPPSPPMKLETGENAVALPAAEEPAEAGEGTPATAATAADYRGPAHRGSGHHRSGRSGSGHSGSGRHPHPRRHPNPEQIPAVTPTAAALVASVDQQLGRHDVKDVSIYVNGRWKTYRPGRSRNFPLYTSEGVVLKLRHKGTWLPPAGGERATAPMVRLHPGWNFVAAPYPTNHMTCHAVRLELGHTGDKLEQITVGPSPTHGMIMAPNSKGEWGEDLSMVIDDESGFWVKDAGSATWTPNPVQYGERSAGIR